MAPAIVSLNETEVKREISLLLAGFEILTGADIPEATIPAIVEAIISEAPYAKPDDLVYFFKNLAFKKFFGKPTGNDILCNWREYLNQRAETCAQINKNAYELAPNYGKELSFEELVKIEGAKMIGLQFIEAIKKDLPPVKEFNEREYNEFKKRRKLEKLHEANRNAPNLNDQDKNIAD